jgi:hypothetical protein
VIFKAAISFPMDSALPRDQVSITPHFFGDNAQALADALKANLIANASVGATTPFIVKIYDAQKTPPSYPLATSTNGTGFTTSTLPREIALCLSYYSTWNRPQYRGRLYIPGHFIGGPFPLRPTSTQMGKALAWATIFRTGLPANHNWVLYSPKRGAADGVSNWWVDDEWDIVRSRGLRGTTRQVGP